MRLNWIKTSEQYPKDEDIGDNDILLGLVRVPMGFFTSCDCIISQEGEILAYNPIFQSLSKKITPEYWTIITTPEIE